jgi:hypothetical protein
MKRASGQPWRISASPPQNVANLSCSPFLSASDADSSGIEDICDGPQRGCTGLLGLANGPTRPLPVKARRHRGNEPHVGFSDPDGSIHNLKK